MARSTNTQFAVAVHVLTYLAGLPAGASANSDELAGSTGSNPVYVRRVLGPLRQGRLVTSRPGARGGWQLAVPAVSISLSGVWRLVNGDDLVLGLHGPNPSCPVGQHVLRSLEVLDSQVGDAVERELSGHTVADLLVDMPSVLPR